MSECTACKGVLPDEAAFCNNCGAAQAANRPPLSALNPEVEKAKKSVQSFVETHGRIPVAILAGGAVAALGTVVPFAHIGSVLEGNSSYSIIQGGFYGVMLLALSIVLGVFPIFLKPYERLRLAAYGISCALLGIFVAVWLASSGFVSMIGSTLGGSSIGLYLSLIGYAAMVVGYYMLQSAKE